MDFVTKTIYMYCDTISVLILLRTLFNIFQALVKLLIMFLVHWGYAIANIVVVFLVWSYVGHANPAVKPGVSAEFKFFEWLRNAILRLMG